MNQNKINLDIKPQQSIELLKELHILTRDGKINQDSRRKLKQVYHLYHFIEPLLQKIQNEKKWITLADHGAGKSYLGFIIYDLFFKSLEPLSSSRVYGIETRKELTEQSIALKDRLGFKNMSFLNLSTQESMHSPDLPQEIDIVTALHACDTATDDAIEFAIQKRAKYIILIPCCQAEMARYFRENKKISQNFPLSNQALTELWRHPLHAREFGSHLTNTLRGLRLESSGYNVTVTELVGFEHSLKNELIVAQLKISSVVKSSRLALEKMQNLIHLFGLQDLQRYSIYNKSSTV